jgi:GPH family glycoside/pentoside/hexuronide:cation symporter
MTWPLRLFYAVGQLSEGVKTAAFGFFLLFYYNQVLGLSGGLAGLALFIALCFDAVSDPLVGSWSDFTRSRWGRRHPFMYAAALPFAASYFLLFVPPSGLGEAGLFAWLVCFSVLTRTAMTFYQVPYLSMGAELTNSYDERTLLAALRNVFQLLGMFTVLIGGNLLFFSATPDYPNGQLNPDAYRPFAAAGIPFLLLGVLLSALGTHREIGRLKQPASTSRPHILQAAISDVITAFRIPAFRAIVGASILFGINQGMVQALHLYMATYFFELSSGQITILFACAITGIVAGSLLSRPAAGLIREKRNLFIAGTAWYAFFTSSIIILRLMDLLPGNEDPIVAVLYITSGGISAVGLGIAIPMIGSMIADVTDEHERLHGTRQEGVYYAAASFAGKAVGGAGPILAGIIIDLSGIVPGIAPTDVDPAVISRFGWAAGPSVIVLTALSITCVWFYGITRSRHGEILSEIRENQGPARGVKRMLGETMN